MHQPTLGFRAVLYTHALEPITVLQLTPQARNHLLECGIVVIQVHEPLKIEDFRETLGKAADFTRWKTVTIRAEELRRHRHSSLMLFTEDEENALLLRSAFLPGQQRELNDRRGNDFARGFLAAIDALGR